MVEATWGGTNTQSPVEWHMSAALEDVPRGGEDFAEVTSLEGAIRAWMQLDPEHQRQARLTFERQIVLDGLPTAALTGRAIEMLVAQLPAKVSQSEG